ncbi:MAG TPA: M48 family peptidase [Actinobacteria bacterium]|nr:M48 family peptidase [Actinomycetes bacterium]HEX21681.1 M48 family peptidase [Actinomycetota bacterium]
MNSSTYTISLKNNVIPFKVKRSAKRRKTISISVRHPEGVVVRAPLDIRQVEITELLTDKTPWILKKLAEIEEISTAPIKNYENGALLKFLGRDYPLNLKPAPANKGMVDFDNKDILVYIPATIAIAGQHDWVQEALRLWYMWQAEITFNKTVARWSEQTGLKPGKIRIKELKSCWGVCSPKNNISFNWRLIMAPTHIIDYIVIHELCHIEQKNHSKKYYNLLSTFQPEYKEYRRELRAIGTEFKL